MTTAYTSLLGLALPVTGELQGTWGTTVNNYITSYLDAAVAGTQNLSTDADATLTVTTNASLSSTSSQYSILLFSGARTAQRTVTVPAASKIYTVINATTGGYAVKVVASGPTTGITIANGESAVIAWNGSDFIKISNTGGAASFTNVTISGTTTLSGLTASTALALDASKNVVSVTNTGTGNNVLSASPTLTGTVAGASLQLSSLTSGRVTYAGASGLLQDSASLTFDGTTLTAGGFSTSGSVTLSGGTANGVLYLNGSKVATSGTALTFDGTTLGTNRFSMTGFLATFNNDNFYMEFQRSGTPFGYIGTGSNTAGGAVTDLGVRAQNNLVFAANATEQMRLTSTGLGIGTSLPAAKLDVAGNINVKQFVSAGSGSTDAYLGYSWNRNLATGSLFDNAKYAYNTIMQPGSNNLVTEIYSPGGSVFSANALVLTSSGNLGLGVTPSAWVSVTGFDFSAVASLEGSSTQSIISANQYNDNGTRKYRTTAAATFYRQTAGAHQWFNAASGTAGNAITFTQAMTLDASGQLGIGTSSPSYKIDAVGGPTVLRLKNSNSTDNTAIRFAGNQSNADLYLIGTNVGSNGTGANFQFYDLVAATTRLTIDSSGNVGIGTSSPGSKLDVAGSAVAQTINDTQAYSYGTSGPVLAFQGLDSGSTKTQFASLKASPASANPDRGFLNVITRINGVNTTTLQIGTGLTGDILMPAGNLGLGVTPSAWNTNVPVKGLQIGSATSLYDAGVTYGSGLAYNFYSSNSGDKYLNNGYASSYVQKTGQHIWFNAASGTAGNAISFTQAMTLDASGNLGVGETSPSTYGRFIVRGTGFVASAIAGDSTSETQLRFLTNTGARISQQANQPLIFDTNATERARITSGGDLLVGTTSLIAAEKLNLTSTAAATYTLMQQTSGITAVYGVNGTGAYSGSYTNQPYLFYTNNTERARIDSSGNLLVGTTSQLSNGKFAVYQGSNGCAIEAQIVGSGTAYAVYTARVNNTANLLHVFYYNTYSSSVGSISTDGTNTAYNTSSDYRLKNNPQPLTGSGAFIDALKPKTWTWKADGSKGVGFIAHEVQEVSPGSVVGEKDGEQMQAMEYGSAEFIANIIAELQQLRARVAQLEKGN